MARVPKSLLWKTIRTKCLDCCAHQHKEVDLCEAKDCPNWMFRFGSASAKRVPELREMVSKLPKGPPRPPQSEIEDPIEAALRKRPVL